MSDQTEPKPDEVAPPTGSDRAERPAGTARRKRRRRLGAIGLILGVLVLLIWALPYAASVGPARDLILSKLSNRIKGRVRAEQLSISWLGPCTARGVRVDDPEGREVLTVKALTWSGGVLRAIFSRADFGQVDIHGCAAVVYLDETGRASLPRAFHSRKPTPKRPPAPLPELSGKVGLDGSSVRIVRADGRAYEISQIEGRFDTTRLDAVSGHLTLVPAGGGRIRAEVDVRQFVSRGRLSPASASGSIRVAADPAVDLAGLGALAVGLNRVEGRAGLAASVTLAPGDVRGEFTIALSGFRAAYAAAAGGRPIDVRVSGAFGRKGEQVDGQVELSGEAGRIRASFTYNPPAMPVRIATTDVLAAIVGGEPMSLPEFTLTADGRVNLEAVGRSAPALLRLRPDVEITGGAVTVENLSLSGGSEPAASGKIELAGLTARAGERQIRWQPIVATFAAALKPRQGLHVREALLRADFGEFTARGTPEQMAMRYRFDLAGLGRSLREVFELGSVEISGQVSGKADLARKAEDRIDLAMTAGAESLSWTSGRRKLKADRLDIRQTGHLSLTGNAPRRLSVSDAAFDLDGAVTGSGSGWFDLDRESFQGRFELKRADLAYVGRQAGALGVAALEAYSGTLSLEAGLARDSAGGAVASTGSGQIVDLRARGKPIGEGPVRLRWSDGRFAPGEKLLTAAAVGLASKIAELEAEDVRLALGAEVAVDAKVKRLAADVAAALATATPFTNWKQPPPVSGRLEWSGSARTTARETTLSGSGSISGLQYGGGKWAVSAHEDRATFAHRLGVDWPGEEITLESLEVACEALSARLAGRIRRFRTTGTLDLTGSYQLSWERLMPMLYELAPELAKSVALAGTSASEFTLTGPANRPELRPVYRGLTGGVKVGFSSGTVYGVRLGEAVLSPALRDGRIDLPEAVVPASGGKVRLVGAVELGPGPPVLRITDRTQLLENVPVNARIGKSLLSRFNPVFSELDLAEAQGRLSLTVQDLALPLGPEIRRGGAGRGVLELKDLKLLPRGLLAILVGPLAAKAQPVKVNSVAFNINQGRVHFDNFTMTFAGALDLRFYGSVGFDDSLRLWVTVPVQETLLSRLGIKSRVVDFARLLQGVRVGVPVVGTRLRPRLDLKKVDIRPLIQRATQALLVEEAFKRAKKALSPKRPTTQTRPAEQADPGASTRPRAGSPGQQLLDAMFELLEDRLDRSSPDQPKR